MDASCPEVRPSAFADCIAQQWFLPSWVRTYPSDVEIQGNIALPSDSKLTITGSLVFRQPPSVNLTAVAPIVFMSYMGATLEVLGMFHFYYY